MPLGKQRMRDELTKQFCSPVAKKAHRTLVVRELKGLQDLIGVSVVDYLMLDKGW